MLAVTETRASRHNGYIRYIFLQIRQCIVKGPCIVKGNETLLLQRLKSKFIVVFIIFSIPDYSFGLMDLIHTVLKQENL